MKQGSNSRRSRGRGNGGKRPQKNHNFDSSGPEGRVRGNAQQVYEKYVGLARDAQLVGDRIATENYFQHAEHYLRVLMSQDNGDGRMEAFRQRQQRLNDDEFGEGDESEDLMGPANRQPQNNASGNPQGYQGGSQNSSYDNNQGDDRPYEGRSENRRDNNRQDNRQQGRQEGRSQEGRSEGRSQEPRSEGRSQEGRSQEGRSEGRSQEGRSQEPRSEARSQEPREPRPEGRQEGRRNTRSANAEARTAVEGEAPREGREGGNARRVPIERANDANRTGDDESDDDGLRRTLAI